MKKSWLFAVYRGLYLPSYVGIIVNHYKDPYQTTRISWKLRQLFFMVQLPTFTIKEPLNEMLRDFWGAAGLVEIWSGKPCETLDSQVLFTKLSRYHPNGGILTYISCMDTAYVRENFPPPKNSRL